MRKLKLCCRVIILKLGNLKPNLSLSLNRANFSNSYSTSTGKNSNSIFLQRLDPNFIEWFVGFSDGEGSFGFIKSKSKNTYVFSFRILLHIDDLEVLNYIKDNLGLGKVSSRGKICVLVVSKLSEIKSIIEIFELRPLNTTKHLNFISFKEAYTLFTNSEFSEELVNKLEQLRSGINRKRIDFNLPADHEYSITPNWLLGFTEGDGSFFVTTTGLGLNFTLTQAGTDFDLMEKIADFFNNLASFKSNSQERPAKVYKYKELSLQPKKECDLKISSVDYIRDNLIPFFSGLTWHTKKHLDFLDWTTILKLKDLGLHYSDDGLELIKKIMSQMNSKRLSSLDLSKINRDSLELEISEILNNANSSNYEIREGRVWIKSLNRFQSQFKGVPIKLFDSEGNLLAIYPSLLKCSKEMGILRHTLMYRLKNNNTFEYKGKLVYLKKE